MPSGKHKRTLTSKLPSVSPDLLACIFAAALKLIALLGHMPVQICGGNVNNYYNR